VLRRCLCALIIKQIAKSSVYSLHKSSTRDFILKKAASLGYSAQVVAQMRVRDCAVPQMLAQLAWQYDLPATMRFHKQKSKDIEVDLIYFQRLPPAAKDL
jgi:predicted RNA methylase